MQAAGGVHRGVHQGAGGIMQAAGGVHRGVHQGAGGVHRGVHQGAGGVHRGVHQGASGVHREGSLASPQPAEAARGTFLEIYRSSELRIRPGYF